MLGVHSQHDQCPEIQNGNQINKNFNLHKNYVYQNKCTGQYRKQHLKKQRTIRTLFSCFPGRDEMRQRNTAHDKISGPISFASKALKLEIIASIS